MHEALESRTFLPEELNQNVDREFSQKLQRLADAAMAERSETARLVLGKEAVELSAEAVDILRHAIEAMCQGMAVSVVPQHTMLSTLASIKKTIPPETLVYPGHEYCGFPIRENY